MRAFMNLMALLTTTTVSTAVYAQDVEVRFGPLEIITQHWWETAMVLAVLLVAFYLWLRSRKN